MSRGFRATHLSCFARAKVSIEAWRRHYNEVRPHSSLGYLTPAAFKAKHLADVDGGRPPAVPARAGMTKKEKTLNRPISAVFPQRLVRRKPGGDHGFLSFCPPSCGRARAKG